MNKILPIEVYQIQIQDNGIIMRDRKLKIINNKELESTVKLALGFEVVGEQEKETDWIDDVIKDILTRGDLTATQAQSIRSAILNRMPTAQPKVEEPTDCAVCDKKLFVSTGHENQLIGLCEKHFHMITKKELPHTTLSTPKLLDVKTIMKEIQAFHDKLVPQDGYIKTFFQGLKSILGRYVTPDRDTVIDLCIKVLFAKVMTAGTDFKGGKIDEPYYKGMVGMYDICKYALEQLKGKPLDSDSDT